MVPKAIESGKGILKVANGGYSGYINSKGKVIEKIGYSKAQLKKIDIEVDDSASFYSSHFSEINIVISFISLALFFYLFIGKLRSKLSK
jgi:apolipoprotein N-acyltransferase